VTHQSRCLLHLRTETDKFPNRCVLDFTEYRTMDKVQNPSNSHIYSVCEWPLQFPWTCSEVKPGYFRVKSASRRFQGNDALPVKSSPHTYIYTFQSDFQHITFISVSSRLADFLCGQTRPFQSEGKACPAKHKVSNSMEDQLRTSVRETELPPTHIKPCFKGSSGCAEGVRECWMPYYWFACLSR
jgi:hypothetical protein